MWVGGWVKRRISGCTPEYAYEYKFMKSDKTYYKPLFKSRSFLNPRGLRNGTSKYARVSCVFMCGLRRLSRVEVRIIRIISARVFVHGLWRLRYI